MAKTTDRTAKPAAKGNAKGTDRKATDAGKETSSKATTKSSSASRPAVKAKTPETKSTARPGKDSGARPSARAAAAAISCPYSKDELGKWRQLLVQRRHEISDDIGSLEKDAMEAEDGHTTPNHIAERGSDADLQDVSLNIAGDEKVIIWQIDRAIRKIDCGEPIVFGICEHTKVAIQKNRLQLIPWTPLSIEGAQYCEENGLVLEDVILDD
jgi:RNA polymerase-binding transcription factor DksA